MISEVKIGDKWVGGSAPCFIVAELSANARSLQEAKDLVMAAKEAGADAVKCQTYKPSSLTIESNLPPFLITWQGVERTLFDLYKEAAMPWDWQPDLKKYAESLGLIWFSTPFDDLSLLFLSELKVPCYKIASFECNDPPFIQRVASKGKPVMISTGMATRKEIRAAIKSSRASGWPPIILKCTSSYPAPLEDANLAQISVRRIGEETIIYGVSDHTLGSIVPVVAVCLGAKVIEKHLILRRSDGGPDSGFSLEPSEFKEMVGAVRQAEVVMGQRAYKEVDSELEMRSYRRSLFAVEDIERGREFNRRNMRSIRPAGGLDPNLYDEVLGRKAACFIPRGTPLTWEMLK
mgnify:CR=1 FL=1